MKRSAFPMFLLSLCVITALGCTQPVEPVEPVMTAPISIPDLDNVDNPQIVATPDGGLFMAWTERRESFFGFDLYVSTLEDGTFSEPVQVNGADRPLNSVPIDEMRPAIAFGSNREVGLAWTDEAYDIQVALSSDGGRSFGESIRLNQDEGEALQEFPDIAFGSDGVLHAVWLDPRIAEEGLEEPADLYYARIVGGVAREQNLTASQESSVCGCCLPDIKVLADGNLAVTFRNTADGYRDPFRVMGTSDGEFGEAARVSPPMWEIEICPIAGPIAVDDMTLWFDGSLGYQRLLSAYDPAEAPDVVLEDTDDWFMNYPPRPVSGTPVGTTILLLPAQSTGRLLDHDGHQWRVIAEDVPEWATSAALYQGRLILIGGEGGILRSETRDFSVE